MSKIFNKLWYQHSPLLRNAFLYNCRDNDLRSASKSRIPESGIVEGKVGYVIAEHAVPGYSGKIVAWRPNRKCKWHGIILDCMAHPGIPPGKQTKPSLRHRHHAVAILRDAIAVALAGEKGLPIVVTSKGKCFINVELTTFEKQGKGSIRRAKLVG